MSARRSGPIRHGDARVHRPVWLRDSALAAAVAAAGLAFSTRDPLGAALVLGLSAPLALRRTHPVIALAVASSAAVAHLLLAFEPTAAVVAVPVLVHGLARWSGRTLARTGLAIALAGAVAGPVRWLGPLPEPSAAGDLLTTVAAHAGTVLVAYVVGLRSREQAERAARRERRQRERQRLALAERERAASAAVVRERDLLAREVHDVVAHSLAMIAVQAEGGRALAERRPEQASRVLAVISGAAREALEEMRGMVAALRRQGTGTEGPAEGSAAGYRTPPGLDGLAGLVGGAGERARLSLRGRPPGVGPVLGLTVYRVVQESLTNFLRHAGPDARLEVAVVFTRQSVEVTALDDGRGADAPVGAGGGHGLRTMEERVRLCGGTFSCGPRPEGGFGVRALLPLRDGSGDGRPGAAAEEGT